MYASKRTIKMAHERGKGFPVNPSKEIRAALELGYDINPAYVIGNTPKRKLNKLQKENKSRKTSRNARMYNLLHA